MLNKKLTTAIVTAALSTVLSITPAFASTGVVLSGNGAGSSNTVNSNTTNTTTASQSNSADVNNNINADSSSGGNTSSFNTGGTTEIITGNATNTVGVDNQLNANHLQLSGNCGCDGSSAVVVADNGAFSTGNVNLNNNNTTDAFQTNAAHVNNDITAKAQTGWNNATDNTGGDNLVLTGNAKNVVGVQTVANDNTAILGGAQTGAGVGTDVRLLGNGALSTQEVDVNKNNSTVVSQDNAADVYNTVKGGAETGWNDSSFGTGGSSLINTGSATNWTGVSNVLNKNWVDAANCGCADDTFAKVAGDGAFSLGTINTNSNNALDLFGTNAASVSNDVTPHAKTGNNTLLDETSGIFGGDPVILTGASSSTTSVMNEANLNVVTSGGVVTPLGTLDMGFDPSALWAMIGLH